jgi:hypothetical protein
MILIIQDEFKLQVAGYGSLVGNWGYEKVVAQGCSQV